MRKIPGVLDYRLLAQQHRPQDMTAIAAEARRLAETGLTVPTIRVVPHDSQSGPIPE